MAQNNSKDKVVVKKHYYKSGALWWESPYVDGKKHGIEKNYDKDTSNIARLELYDKGRIVPLLWNLESNV